MEIVKGITWLAIIVQIHALYPVSTLNTRFTYILLSELPLGQVEMRERRGGDKGGGCVVSWMLENGRYSETLRMVRGN